METAVRHIGVSVRHIEEAVRHDGSPGTDVEKISPHILYIMRAQRKKILLMLPLLMLAVAILGGCRERPHKARDIFRRSATGVVLVSNRYYYAANVGGKMFYFTGVSADGTLEHLTDNADTASAYAPQVAGTGFFINRVGSILTNRHLVRPDFDRHAVNISHTGAMKQLENFLTAASGEAARLYGETEARLHAATADGDARMMPSGDAVDSLRMRLRGLRNNQLQYLRALEHLDNIDSGDIVVKSANSVSVSPNPGRKGKTLRTLPCSVVKVSGIDRDDLAVIKLKRGRTPRGSYIFHFKGYRLGKHTKLESFFRRLYVDYSGRRVKEGAKLCMVGFAGDAAALAADSVPRVRMSKGRVVETDADDGVIYAAASTPMSAGSPVMNMFGDVVCVNVGTTADADTLSRGVSLKSIKNFLGK